ncbi:MAG: ABC transporter permease [Hungatella sp.]|jgi:peptide/nickel transport system permease protein|nr:ABC transporter permease [Hungatella sp.]
MDKKILLRRMRRSPQFVVGGILVVFLLFIALFAKWIAPNDPNVVNTMIRLKPPGFVDNGVTYYLGTDQQGRDILSRLLVGSSASIFISIVATVAVTIIGTSLGIWAGYKGGIIDNIIMRATEVTMAVPTLTLGIVIVAVFGASIPNLILIMVVNSWNGFARIARNNVMVIKNREFVQASKVLGAKSFNIMWKQIFPNITTPLIIQASGSFGSIILVESSLSYLYLGIQAPQPSWGNMIADCRNFLPVAPWTVIAPGVALMIAVLGFNLLGDGLRDVLDPKQRR